MSIRKRSPFDYSYPEDDELEETEEDRKEREEYEALLRQEEEAERRRRIRYRLETNDFYNCCGIIEISSFGGYPKSCLIESITEIERYYKNGEEEDNDGIAMMLATTIPKQKSAVAALRACGFSKLPAAFRNTYAGHKNRHKTSITLWYKYMGRKGA